MALVILGALILPALLPQARAQSPTVSKIKPTVTADMGDLGGKYFGQTPDPAKTRHYYIAAEVEQWNYLPIGSDPFCGMTPAPSVMARHIVRKVRYFQYTDGTFTERVPQTPRLGVMGPALRGVVGDYLAITFLNRSGQPLSMHPHGVKYDKDSEGAYYGDNNQLKTLQTRNQDARTAPGLGAAVAAGARFTYVWYMDEQSGPLPSEPSSKGWLYHSHVAGEGEIDLGLEGCIIVTDPKRARPDGTPNDVDREMAALFLIFNEYIDPATMEGITVAGGGSLNSLVSGLPVLPTKNLNAAANAAADNDANERYAINGYIYGNLPGLEMNEGERVRWYLFGLGSEVDLHTAHWHGLRVLDEGARRTDSVELLPASMKVADMVADDPGDWLFHCHVSEHMNNGMFALVTVRAKRQSRGSAARRRRRS